MVTSFACRPFVREKHVCHVSSSERKMFLAVLVWLKSLLYVFDLIRLFSCLDFCRWNVYNCIQLFWKLHLYFVFTSCSRLCEARISYPPDSEWCNLRKTSRRAVKLQICMDPTIDLKNFNLYIPNLNLRLCRSTANFTKVEKNRYPVDSAIYTRTSYNRPLDDRVEQYEKIFVYICNAEDVPHLTQVLRCRNCAGFSKFRILKKLSRFYFFQRDSSQRDLRKRL